MKVPFTRILIKINHHLIIPLLRVIRCSDFLKKFVPTRSGGMDDTMNITFPLILDGAMGTQLYKAGMPSGVCPETWVTEHPDAAEKIQRAYVEAGSQVIYTPTFGANAAILEHNGVFNRVEEYNRQLAAISRRAADGRALVAGDIAPTGGMLYPMGDMSFEELYEIYRQQASALEEAGVDLFVVETMTSVAEARAAVLAVKSVSQKPVFVSFSCDENGRTMMGSDVCAALEIMQGCGVDAFGLNCSVGPEEMLTQIRRLASRACVPLLAKPNAGLPRTVEGTTQYTVSAEEFAQYIPRLAQAGVQIFGACCGSDPDYIAAIRQALMGVPMDPPTPVSLDLLPCATEKELFLLPPDAACTQILACDDELEDNLCELEEGELFGIEIRSIEDVAAFADAQYAIRNPLCLICDDAVLLEKALRVYQGRPLYDGTLPDEVLLPLADKYGLIV